MLDGQMVEFPRLVFLRLGELIEAIPFGIELVWKFLFVLSRLLLNIELESGDDLTAKRFGVKAGIVVARSLVANFVTSLDMAGFSTPVSILDQDMTIVNPLT